MNKIDEKSKKHIIIICDDYEDNLRALRNHLKHIYRDILEEVEIIECTDGIEILQQVYNLYLQNKLVNINCIITDLIFRKCLPTLRAGFFIYQNCT